VLGVAGAGVAVEPGVAVVPLSVGVLDPPPTWPAASRCERTLELLLPPECVGVCSAPRAAVWVGVLLLCAAGRSPV
jgi:hypothetical protein